jgi:hypothetical protein
MERNKELMSAVTDAARVRGDRNVLTCLDAFELARRFKVGVKEIGDICNEQKIKLVECQLGCF